MNRQTSSAGSDLPTLPPRQPGPTAAVGLGRAARLCRHRGLRRVPVAGRAHHAPAPAGAGRHGPGGCRAGGRPVGVPGRQATGGRARSGPYPAAHPGRWGRSWPALGWWSPPPSPSPGQGNPARPGPWPCSRSSSLGLLALVGVVVFPWLFLLTRTVTRERAARVRAEERAEVATHLHDSVLQNTHADPEANRRPGRDGAAGPPCRARAARLALRAGSALPAQDDLVAALRVAAAEVEDRLGVLGGAGHGRDLPAGRADPARSPAPPARRSPTPPSTPGVTRVSVFAEVADGQVVVVVRDRGRGFDQAAAGRQAAAAASPTPSWGGCGARAGTATIRTAPGAGTEVELRMPVARA